MTRGVVHSILEETPEAVARRLAECPRECAGVEIRADHLRAGDVGGLVRRSGRPVVVTVRATADGGSFDGSSEEKSGLLRAAIDAGAEFIDVEWDGPLRALAFGDEAARTILSHHGAPCDLQALAPLFDAMAGSKAPYLKIVPRASRAAEIRAVHELLVRARDARRPLCCFALGAVGAWSRVVALLWGSWGVYGATERGRETGEGQFTTRELLDVYRVEELSGATQWFALCGTPLDRSPSPTLHAAGYRALSIDAVYIPIATGDLDEVDAIAGPSGLLPLDGFGVTIPLKESAAKRCVKLHTFAECGSANTVRVSGKGWEGYNTDAPAALRLIGEHLDPRGIEAAVVGAGGTARAIAAALKEAGASVTLYARNPAKGSETARSIGVSSAPLTTLPGVRWDLLVQATPLGGNGEEVLLRRFLDGRVVLDAAYGAEPTPLVRAARARGLAVIDGLTLLAAQAALQFEVLTGRPAPKEAMAAAAESHASSSSA